MHRGWLPKGSGELPRAPPHLLYLERTSFPAYERGHGPLFGHSKPGRAEPTSTECADAQLAAPSSRIQLDVCGDVGRVQDWRDALQLRLARSDVQSDGSSKFSAWLDCLERQQTACIGEGP